MNENNNEKGRNCFEKSTHTKRHVNQAEPPAQKPDKQRQKPEKKIEKIKEKRIFKRHIANYEKKKKPAWASVFRKRDGQEQERNGDQGDAEIHLSPGCSALRKSPAVPDLSQ